MTPVYRITLTAEGDKWRATVAEYPGCTVTRSTRRLALEHIAQALEIRIQAHEQDELDRVERGNYG